ncbi:MAG: ATP-binding protein [Bacteroidota bacterium]
MISRQMLKKVTLLCKEFPAVAILGPRQVGKTTMAQAISKSLKKPVLYFDLENVKDFQRIHQTDLSDPQYKHHCVIIDEVQRMPELFAQLRPVIDAHRKAGRFILTGSASPELVKGVSESLAGRIGFVELSPISLTEALPSKITMQKHWFRGGFPNALTARSDDAWNRWIENFVRTYIERDLSQLFGIALNQKTIRNFWYMLANNNGGIFNAENYARALGITGPTVMRYLQFLEGAFLVRVLNAWYVNTNKRLVKAPKVYIRDSGILHYLCGIDTMANLQRHLAIGASWEGYVIEQIFEAKSAKNEIYFYRTHHGAEMDIVITKGITPLAVIEIKHSEAPSLSKGFYSSVEDLKPKFKYVIIPEGRNYTTSDGIKVCNLESFLKKEMKNIK